jgi:hypothetical protein
MHDAMPELIRRWKSKLGPELVRKPKNLLEVR